MTIGALDHDFDALIASRAPRGDELSYLTQLRDGRHVILEAGFVTSRTEALVAELDGRDYDLLILAMTGMRARLSTRTPLVHGQDALDAWISALVASNSGSASYSPWQASSRPRARATTARC